MKSVIDFTLSKASSVLKLWGTRMDYQKSANLAEFNFDKVPSILVVDDDEDNQLLLQYTIAMFGWTSIVAVDALSTIQLAKNHQPDLILLDIVLPDISGLQIAAMLKQHKSTCRIPIVAVTGLAEEEEQDLILNSGFDDYVLKPYQLETVYQVVVSNLKINIVKQTA